jgi:glycosyltransferase involved in cell wall biosynthesis
MAKNERMFYTTIMNTQPIPLLTIITPTYKRPQLLAVAMRSVLMQGYANLQYIVVDDAPNDETASVVKQLSIEFPNCIEYIANEKNLGESGSLNKGWAAARGDYVLTLSDDDVVYSDWCARAVSFMEAHPYVAVGYVDWNIIDLAGNALKLHHMPKYSFKRLVSGCISMPGPGTIIRREAYKNITQIRSTRYRYTPDLAMWMRFGVHHPFAHMQFVGAGWRVHGVSISCSANVREKTAELTRIAEDFIQEFAEEKLVRTRAKAIRCRSELQCARLWFVAGECRQGMKNVVRALKISLLHTCILAGCYGKRILNELNHRSYHFLMSEYIK